MYKRQERGSITLIGATTENPSFEINSALLSRCKVFVLQPLKEEEIAELLRRALADERGFGKLQVEMADELVRCNHSTAKAPQPASSFQQASKGGCRNWSWAIVAIPNRDIR